MRTYCLKISVISYFEAINLNLSVPCVENLLYYLMSVNFLSYLIIAVREIYWMKFL